MGDDFPGFDSATTPGISAMFPGFVLATTPVVDFSGFTPVTPVDRERRDILNVIRGDIEELRVRLAQSRKRHRERCVTLRRRISLGPGDRSTLHSNVPLVLSPPQTRSHGRAQELPWVQPSVLEYGDGFGSGK